MHGEKESAPAKSQKQVNKLESYVLETQIGLRLMAGMNEGRDFTGFGNEDRGTMRKLVNVEREMRFMKLLEGIMKYEVLKKIYIEIKSMS